MNKWHIEKITSNWRNAFSPPRAPANVAIVVFEGGTCLGLLGPQTPLSTMRCAQGVYRFHLIPLERRTIGIDERVPAREMGVEFQVYIEVSYRVNNPVAVARDDPPDLDATVKKKIQGLVHDYGGDYEADQWQPLQQALEQHLKRPNLGLGVEVESSIVRVKADQRLVGRRLQIFDATADKDVVRAQSDLDKLKLVQEQELLKTKMEFYAGILKQGRFEQFALGLVDRSEEVKQVVTYFEKERDWVIRERWELFKKWLFSNDAPLIASRMREFVEGLDLLTTPLIDRNRALPSARSQPRGLTQEEEDLDEWIETLREEVDDTDEDGPEEGPVIDPEDTVL